MAIVQLPLARYGITSERDPTRLRSGHLVVGRNLDFSVPGLVQKEGGSAKINGTPLTGSPEVLAGFDWWPDDATQRRVIATGDGKLYKDDMSGAFGTTLKTGLATSRVTHLVAGGAETAGRARRLFVFNGRDPVQVLVGDGIATATITSPHAHWSGTNQPSFGFLFRNFLCAGGNDNNPHFLYGSTATDHEDFAAAGNLGLSIYPGEGLRLIAGIFAFGRAWLFKDTGIYWVEDAAGAVTGWFCKPATREYGIAPSPWAVTAIDEKTVAFVTGTGGPVLMVETAGSLTGVDFIDLSKTLNLQDIIRERFDLSRLHRVQCAWYRERKQLHILYAAVGSTTENRRLVLDFNGEVVRAEITDKDTHESIWMEKDSQKIPRPVTGDATGTAWKLDQASRAVAGSPYTFELSTAPTDFSDLSPKYAVRKAFYRVHLEYEPTGSFTVNADIYVDGKLRGTVSFPQTAGGSTLPLVLPAVLSGGADLRRRSREIACEGYIFQLRLTETGAYNPRIARAWVEFEALGMTL